MANTYYKPVTSIISTKQEENTFVTLNGSGLTFTSCDRTNLTENESNYFVSFNLPFEEDALSTGSTLSLSRPEIQQLNVDEIIISPIPREFYNEIIDGRSVTFTVPQLSGGTGLSAKTVVSSTYTTFEKKQSSSLLGGNIAFLFSDDINLPYAGTTGAGTINHASNVTWDTTLFTNRPAAVSWKELGAADINTDQRAFSGVNQAVTVAEDYPTTSGINGYNYDIPIGFIALDKGFIVLTHPDLVNNIPWTQGFNQVSGTPNTGASSGTTSVYFSGTSTSNVTFQDIDINYKTAVICLALPAEFVFTNNPTWDLQANALELQNQTNGFDPLYVTEVGLYNKNNELIAIAKLSEPFVKTYTGILTFNLEIQV